jgi:hypothetical protein
MTLSAGQIFLSFVFGPNFGAAQARQKLNLMQDLHESVYSDWIWLSLKSGQGCVTVGVFDGADPSFFNLFDRTILYSPQGTEYRPSLDVRAPT